MPLIALALPARTEHIPLFRAAACQCLPPYGLEPIADDVGIVVDELAANAVAVTGPMFTVSMALGVAHDGVVVELHDRSPNPPVLKEAPVLKENSSGMVDQDEFLKAFTDESEVESGRGLKIVDGLSVCWGFDKNPAWPGAHPKRPSAAIKRVWALLPLPEGYDA